MSGTLSVALDALADYAGMIIDTTFPDTGTVQKPVTTLGDCGTGSPTWSDVATGVNCAWGPSGKDAKEYIRALKITGVTTYVISMKATITVKPDYRIVVAARGDEPQRTFLVKGILRNSGVTIDVLCILEES